MIDEPVKTSSYFVQYRISIPQQNMLQPSHVSYLERTPWHSAA